MGIYDKLIPHPPLPETSGPAPPDTRTKEPLTPLEEALLARAKTFISDALRSHGITLAPNEIPFIGALVADFVQAELDAPKPETPEEET